MQADKKEVLKRLSYSAGHLGGIRKMIEEDKYCVDILRQTYAVRKAICIPAYQKELIVAEVMP